MLESSEFVNVFFMAYLYEWTLWIFVFIVVDMNGIGECFLYCFLVWMDSLNVFLIIGLNEWNLWIFVFIICWHEWNLSMCLLSVYVNGTFECFFMIFVYMNGICECFLYGLFFINIICECFLLRLFIHMESLDVLFVVFLYKWNLWMFSLWFVYMNLISESVF